jgi:hypothetical protein
MAMVDRICKNPHCKASFQARSADVKRGWGKFCSKSCKAVKQESGTGQMKHYLRTGSPLTRKPLSDDMLRQKNEIEMHEEAMMDCTSGWDEGGWLN